MTLHRAILALAVAALLVPVAGTAVDEVGVFFDQVGEENCIQAEQFSTLDAYLLLLEPTASVGGWECQLDVENVTILGIILPPAAVNAGLGPTEFVVGLGIPLPAEPAVKLAQVSVMVMGGAPAGFFIYPTTYPSLDGTPAYADGADPTILLPMTPSAIGPNALVAGINRPGCIPEETTWGRVKTIYFD